MCIKDGSRKIHQPFGDIERALMPFELIVIGFPAILDRVGKCNQARLPDILGKRFFGERSAKPAISIFKRMDAFEVQMAYAGTGERGQGEFTVRRRFVEPLGVGRHFRRDLP